MTGINKETPAVSVEPSQTTQKVECLPPQRHRSSRWLMVLLMIVVGCAALAGYVGLQQFQMVNAKIADLNNKLKQTSAELTSSMQGSTNQVTQIEKQLKEMVSEQAQQGNDWVLLKARYYLELAQMNNYWSNHTEVTQNLLSQADSLLARVQSQSLFAVRQAIAEEMSHISAIKVVDMTGLLTQLSVAQQMAQDLKVKQLPLTLHKTAPIDGEKEPTTGWRKRIQEGLSGLEKLIVIRRVNETVQPIITPSFAALLRENIMLILQETQLAVLQHDESLYQLTLKQAIRKIEQSFDPEDANTIALLKQLNHLSNTSMVQDKPNLEQSLTLLNQVIHSKQMNAPLEAPSL